jgi:hypothetical protein
VTTLTEQEAITETVLDYFEGWFEGDTARMERALHHGLVKRQAAEELGVTTKERMVELTGQHAGKDEAGDGRINVTVEDVYKDIASVTVRSVTYHEYLHLVRTSEGWKIANALFEVT